MQPKSNCCGSASANVADEPISQMVVLDYYDGPAGGFVKCKTCGAEFRFFMLDWDDMHRIRIFALAPVPDGSFQGLFALFGSTPDRRIWIPPVLSRASEAAVSDLYDRGVQDLLDSAGAPTIVMAWSIGAEKTLAMREVDSAAMPHLSPWFDRQPDPVAFDWFSYLRVSKPLQPA